MGVGIGPFDSLLSFTPFELFSWPQSISVRPSESNPETMAIIVQEAIA